MHRLPIFLFLILFFAGTTVGQINLELIAKIREIKLLESTRDDVRQILADYNTTESNDHYQRYYNEEVDIRIHFSSGTCTNDTDQDDDSTIWQISEWTVTRIEVEPHGEIAAKALGINLSEFRKEQMYRDSPDLYVYHDKARGVAIETAEDSVVTIVFFPSSSSSKKLCEGSTLAGGFYFRDSWFAEELEERTACTLVNLHADVKDMIVSATEIEATSKKTISVMTIASDPENDVLTYSYKVSAGRIVGTGAKVVWDLTGIPAGNYTITVGVDDGMGIIGQTITKRIEIK